MPGSSFVSGGHSPGPKCIGRPTSMAASCGIICIIFATDLFIYILSWLDPVSLRASDTRTYYPSKRRRFRARGRPGESDQGFDGVICR